MRRLDRIASCTPEGPPPSAPRVDSDVGSRPGTATTIVRRKKGGEMAEAHPSHRRLLRVLVVLLVAALLVIGWLLLAPSPRLQVDRLPPDQRAALYGRAIADLQEICTGPAGRDLEPHCRHQASLVVQMPECDEACRKLASPWLAGPTR